VINIQAGERNGLVVGISLCREADDAMFITAQGMIVRSAVAEMRPMGRNTQGVRLVNLKEDDQLVAMETIRAVELEEYQQISTPRRPRPAILEEGERLDDEPETDDDELDDSDDVDGPDGPDGSDADEEAQ
jgi:DNA gyrase subunit A